MKNGICLKCKAEEVYLSHTDTHGTRIPLGLTIVFTELYVCGKCGFFETYVQHQSDLKKISEKYKKVKVK